ncbi:MAG: pyruvate dehydrogenase (acetyl-transferring) E1 component subunit alpha [Blastochloris sp.]|nr:pyruvate dehydrogenase (acetyl-transferring) E1 component subunit alpha [Blastochloris sp.]
MFKMPTLDVKTKDTKKSADVAVVNSVHANAPVNKALKSEDKIRLLRDMIRIRRFEERSMKSYAQENKIGGFLHLYIGQEAVAVGSISVCGKHDHVITTYRDHGHALAVGMGMDECMAELYGKATGCSKGKGGSMHFFAPDKNFWGGHGIVGGQTPLGLGLAYYQKYKGLKGSCLCYLGDGAVNQGAFHESLNLASLWSIPVIYIIENNGYSMGTSEARSSAFRESLAKRAEGYDMDWDVCMGHDIYEVRAKIKEALDRAHEDSRPTLLEIDTYRYEGHSVADANRKKYRSPEEIENYKQTKDPIQLFKKRLISEGVLTEEAYEVIDQEAKAEANASAAFADASPWPAPESMMEDIYWEVDHGRTSQGTLFFNDEE